MDVVSEGEYRRARAAGVPGDRIVFSGVGKTEDEMRHVLSHGVRQINLESEPEMRLLSRVASELGLEVPVAVRVNPDVDAKTHEKIATGKSENKFGIPIARARVAEQLEDGDVRGGLDGVADQMRPPGQRLVEEPEMPQQRGGGIDVGGRAHGAGDLGQRHILGVQRAVPVEKVIHQRLPGMRRSIGGIAARASGRRRMRVGDMRASQERSRRSSRRPGRREPGGNGSAGGVSPATR